jgi:hypothetical protein
LCFEFVSYFVLGTSNLARNCGRLPHEEFTDEKYRWSCRIAPFDPGPESHRHGTPVHSPRREHNSGGTAGACIGHISPEAAAEPRFKSGCLATASEWVPFSTASITG